MSKKNYTTKQASKYFNRVNNAWKVLGNGHHVQFIENQKVVHGIVLSRWEGSDPRLVVLDDKGAKHEFRDITKLMVLSDYFGAYVPATEFLSVD